MTTILHATDIREFHHCRRKFFYEQIERLKPKANTEGYGQPEYFDFGSSWDKLLTAHYSKEPFDFNSITNLEHRGHIKTMYELYVKHWEEADKKLQSASIGQTIELEWEGEKFQFTMDWLVLDKFYRIIDHKAYAKMSSNIQLDWDFQGTFYLWAANKKGIPAKEFILNIARKGIPEYPNVYVSGKNKGQLNRSATAMENYEYDTYLEAIHAHKLDPADYQKELIALKQRGSSMFRRIPMRRTDGQLKAFEDNLRETVRQIKYIEQNPIAALPTWDYLKCPKCPFRVLCRTQDSGGDYDFTKKSMYEVKQNDER